MVYKEDKIKTIKTIEENGFTVFYQSDDITKVIFDDHLEGTIHTAKKLLDIYKTLSPDKKVLLMVVYGNNNSFTPETREFVASKHVSETVKAEALIINNLAFRIIANFYFKVNKPTRPSKAFKNEEDARNWLYEFK